MEYEKLLELAGEHTKKRRNKKCSESITPIRYVIQWSTLNVALLETLPQAPQIRSFAVTLIPLQRNTTNKERAININLSIMTCRCIV